jgi:hypothetical protein
MSKQASIRRALAVVTAGIAVICLALGVGIYWKVSLDAGVPNLPYNDIVAKSLDTQLDLSGTLFHTALLTFGALWALVIAKKDEVKLVFSNLPDSTMFMASSALLLLSVLAYGFYLNLISTYLTDAGAASARLPPGAQPSIPDIWDQNVNYLFRCQVAFLIAGVVNGAVTLISMHHLKGESA